MKNLILCLFATFSFTGFANAQKVDVGVDITQLMFSENWFSDLEEAKANPDKVLYLDLSLQKMKSFPMEIIEFGELKHLYLAFNYWQSIPDAIGKLSNLEILDISGNYYMNKLPEGLKDLPNIQKLIVKDDRLNAGELDKFREWHPNCIIVEED